MSVPCRAPATIRNTIARSFLPHLCVTTYATYTCQGLAAFGIL